MEIKGKVFKNETIILDGKTFVGCTFHSCELVYQGSLVVGLVECSFHDVKWSFADAAARTINFLAELYHGAGEGGRQLVEQTFDKIRRDEYLRQG